LETVGYKVHEFARKKKHLVLLSTEIYLITTNKKPLFKIVRVYLNPEFQTESYSIACKYEIRVTGGYFLGNPINYSLSWWE
jgi:predicted nucleic acid-binding protein